MTKALRPVFAALDRRLDALATRLERHTERLAADQRTDIHRIDDRLTLDVAVLSEHLVGIDRTARRVAATAQSLSKATSLPERIVLALPGEPLCIPDGGGADGVVSFIAGEDGVWSRTTRSDESTLRVVVLQAPTAT